MNPVIFEICSSSPVTLKHSEWLKNIKLNFVSAPFFKLSCRESVAAVCSQVHREASPPIPTLQKKHGQHQYTPRPPTVDSQRSSAPLSVSHTHTFDKDIVFVSRRTFFSAMSSLDK